jgi:hypothetical protein
VPLCGVGPVPPEVGCGRAGIGTSFSAAAGGGADRCDADLRSGNFAALSSLPRPALAFLRFWYLLDPASRAVVADAIRPRRVVAVDVPPRDASDVQERCATRA